MSKKVIIIGAGGHAKVIADIVIKSGDELVGFLDDDEKLQNQVVFDNKKVIGKSSDSALYKECSFIIGIGNNETRKSISEKYNLNWYTAIHPSALIGTDVKIEEGTAVMAGVVINTGTRIGKHCIINTSTSIDHDNIIGDYVHISPGAHLAGTVHVGELTWICIGTTIINNINILDRNIIGAGSVVTKNIEESNAKYVGIPARKIK